MRCFLAGAMVALSAVFGLIGCEQANTSIATDVHFPVADFALTERSGDNVRRADLLGKTWVAAFIFTRCAGPCTQISGVMAHLQHDLAGLDNVMLVSFTVDRVFDLPEVLHSYAIRFEADPIRWL